MADDSERSLDGSRDDDENRTGMEWLNRQRTSSSMEEVISRTSNAEGLPPSGVAAVDAAEEELPAFLPPLPPQREEPTLKEKLVERERQARVERERARLKRQFALMSNGGGVEEESGGNEEDLSVVKEHGSVEGTVGEESSVAAHHTEEPEPATDGGASNEPLGYAMERFLADRERVSTESAVAETAPTRETGVVMERFLSDPVVVDTTAGVDEQVVAVEETGLVTDEDHEQANESPPLQTMPENVPSGSSSFTSDFIARDEEMHRTEEMATTGEANAQEVEGSFEGASAMAVNGDVENRIELVPSRSDIGATAGSIRSYSTVTDDGLPGADSRDTEIDTPPVDLDLVSTQRTGVSIPSFELEEDDLHGDGGIVDAPPIEHSSSTDTPPRVFRLTEAEIQEMAAIEEASIGNAPPSEREALSESSLVGDLVGDLLTDGVSGVGMDPNGAFSERTQTTALESGSATVTQSVDGDGQQSEPATEHSIDHIASASVSSQLALSPGDSSARSVSVTAMPPSESGADDGAQQSSIPEEDVGSIPEAEDSFLRPPNSSAEQDLPPLHALADQDDHHLDAEASAAANAGVVNRTIRPGMVATAAPLASPSRDEFRDSIISFGSPSMKKSASLPSFPLVVDDFDFDKFDHVPATPRSGMDDSLRDLPGGDIWSPPGRITVSPLRAGGEDSSTVKAQVGSDEGDSRYEDGARYFHPRNDLERGIGADDPTRQHYNTDYGSALEASVSRMQRELPLPNLGADEIEGPVSDERRPLLGVPGELQIANAPDSHHHDHHHMMSSLTLRDLKDLVESVFSSVRSESTASIEAEENESDKYLASSILARAFPERFSALLVTLLVEIPVLLMISGGSDRLCALIGRSRYQLLMAFLPLSSAISGNCGLQASTLTTRAISHSHVTKTSYLKWLRTEVGAACYLGLGMGIVLGLVAYFASGNDIAFGLTIFMAQIVSIVTAGCTGTLAPLMFSFIFHRDSGKWGGPLETAIQDIVGSFAMVVLSYQLLRLFPLEVAPSDRC